MTGRTPNRSGVFDWIPQNHIVHLKSNEITVATLLKQVGYQTVHIGKWHLNGKFNSAEQPQPDDHGFDYWLATQNNAAPSHENPTNFVRNGERVGPQEGFSCQLVADETIAWLNERRNDEKPFYLQAWFHEPHEPVASPRDLVKGYEDVAINEDQAQYFANVENMDKAVGRIVAQVDELGLGENTLIFFTSDNGPETLKRYRGADRSYGSPGPLRGMKLHIYEGGIRVPGIMRWTGMIEPGQVVETPVCGLDLLPTACELAGRPAPSDRALDGTSLVSLIEGEEFERTDPLFWHYYRAISPPRVALRDGDWKIVAHWDGPTIQEKRNSLGRNVSPQANALIKTAKLVRFELYNLSEDIGETTDVAAKHPEILSELKAKVVAKYREVQEESPNWYAE